MTPPLLRVDGLVKDYRGLRPLRIQKLALGPAESTAIVGLDQPSAEVLVNLLTGASLPDAGDIVAFGRSTRDISDSADWLSVVDRFGIVTPRAALLEPLSVLQNLAMPFTLEIDPLDDEARARASALAREGGFAPEQWDAPVGSLDPEARTRLRVARACALDPQVLLLEHVSAELPAAAAPALGVHVRGIASHRGAAVLALTADEAFARAVAARVLRWEPATGRLTERRGWFGGSLG